MDLELTCVSCGKRFFARRADARACSQACRTRLSRARRAEGSLHPGPSAVGSGGEVGAEGSGAGVGLGASAAQAHAVEEGAAVPAVAEGVAAAFPREKAAALPRVKAPPQHLASRPPGSGAAAEVTPPPTGAPVSAARRPAAARSGTGRGVQTVEDRASPGAAAGAETTSGTSLSSELAPADAGRGPAGSLVEAEGVAPARGSAAPAELAAEPGAGPLAGLDREGLLGLGLSAALTAVVAEQPEVRVAMKFLGATTRAVGALAAQQLGSAAADPLALEGAPAGDALVGWLLERVRDRALWETLLQRGDLAVRELFVALAQVEVEKGRVALKVGPGNAQLEGVLAVERLLAADPALRAAVAAARGAALISVRMALSVRARGGEKVGDGSGADGGAGAAGVVSGAGEGSGVAGGSAGLGAAGGVAERSRLGEAGATGLSGVGEAREMPKVGVVGVFPAEVEAAGRARDLDGSSLRLAGGGVGPAGGWPAEAGARRGPVQGGGAASVGRDAALNGRSASVSGLSGAGLVTGGAPAFEAVSGAAMLEVARLRSEMGGLRTELVRSQSEVATLRVAVERLNEVMARRAVEVSELRGAVEQQRVELGYLRTVLVAVLEGVEGSGT